jgi:hypothetical protein
MRSPPAAVLVPALCSNAACSAHLVSAGCVQFGVIELEAAFNMPPSSGGAQQV